MSPEHRATVLVIDDSEICLEPVTDALEDAGYRVVTSTQPLGANRLVAQVRPDVVVLDIGMPALEGSTLAEIIARNRAHRCPVLLHTARTRDEMNAKIAACGADGGALKSADCQELLAEIRRVLAWAGPDPL